MPKAILKFNLPEEENEFRACIDGGKWSAVIYNLDEWLRQNIKYGNKFQDIEDALQSTRAKIREFIKEYDVFCDL